ncbi:hypothetical protein T4B_4974 [Trichinella pseudospiralis]|uniref:Uncharacterized protein n=1 Tax=Trichinella pseudospiralis TaxID=6337 RepID=A0A0V1GQD9_TRIPS|nr:hypothetical protein T4B_4974 [Trichinella pseudospiralis]
MIRLGGPNIRAKPWLHSFLSLGYTDYRRDNGQSKLDQEKTIYSTISTEPGVMDKNPRNTQASTRQHTHTTQRLFILLCVAGQETSGQTTPAATGDCRVHLLNVGLQADTVPSELQDGLKLKDLQVRPGFELARDEASTKFDLLDRSLEPLPSNRSPRTDTSSVRIPAVPPRSAPVCALRQANDALPGENYSAVWACMEATEVRLRTIAFPEPCQRLYIQWGRLVFGSDVNGVPKSPQDLVSGFFHTRQEGGHSGGWPSIGMPTGEHTEGEYLFLTLVGYRKIAQVWPFAQSYGRLSDFSTDLGQDQRLNRVTSP